MKTLSLVSMLIVLAACHPGAPLSPPADADAALPPEITPIPAPEATDAAPEPQVDGSTSTAARACAALAAHHCPEAALLDGGESCTQLFTVEDRRKVYDLHTACIAKATSLAAIRSCGATCPGGR